MIDNLALLKKCKTLEDVHNSPYFQEYFVKRYLHNLPLMALEVFGLKLTYQQVDVLLAHDFEGGRTAVPSGHGCHGADTPIMMYDGSIKKVQDISAGDKLMGDDGKTERNVLSLARGQEELFEVEYINGISRVYNGSHILYLVLYNGNNQPLSIKATIEEWLQWGDEKKKKHYAVQYCNGQKILIPIVSCKSIGIDNYYGVEVDNNNLYLDADGVVTSNTGKTKLIGFLASAFLLLFRYSIVRIQAPKLDQVTKFSFKEINACLNGLIRKRKMKDGRIIENKWAFLHRYIQINTESIYIKGFQKNWYIEPATAPKGDPTNLSGQHGWAYLLIFDEASGIPDSHIQGSLGALSQKINSCIAFSQHTRTAGMFNDFVTTQSIDYGGVWKVVRLNSEQSPMVNAKAIKAWRSTYTDNEYRVRVLGLPPLYTDGYLLNEMEVMKAYSRENKDWVNKLNFSSLTISTDVAYTGIRDSGVNTVLNVAVKADKNGNDKLYVIVYDVDVYNGQNAKLPTELAKEAYKKLLTIKAKETNHNTYNMAIDATAGGHEAYTILSDLVAESGLGNINVYGITWGLKRLMGTDKRRFMNQRAKAYIMLQEAIKEGRFYIATNKYKTRILRELANIPFKFTSDFKYKMVDKEEMSKKGIPSPDIVDTLAQQFLIGYMASSDDLAQESNVEIDDNSELDIDETIEEIGETYNNSELELDLDLDIMLPELT
ncbi:MAG: Hint domain-containing homing endonuclease [Sulfurovaceae bacterium]